LFEQIDFDIIEIRKLDNTCDLSRFNCSINDSLGLNQFIHDEALDFQENHLGITYLFYYRTRLVGYVTLAMGRLKGIHPDLEESERRIRWFPALLIGRLASHNDCRDLGVGRFICDWCTGLALSLSEEVGCKFVVADTDEYVKGFYEKCQFMSVKEENNIILFKKIH